MTRPDGISFGERLASLRKAAGFTQVELAAELGNPTSASPADLVEQ